MAAMENQTQTQTPKISLYEQSREERIKQNLQRMQQLGLKDLSNSLLNTNPRLSSKRGRPTLSTKRPLYPLTPPLQPSSNLRRSSRLQNTTPVTYSEAVSAKRNDLLEDVELKLEKSEVYTEEHEKLLGNTERSWTLFVDGYGSDGKRVYDSYKGKTCHQCRQKTLGHRTNCSKCQMVQGQFCGDCLYMRYGEHVLEANDNPDWVCPVCRGICNCSLCRQAKGWAPTGTLYRKITKMGFKSVAHYLIQTLRVQTDIKKNPDNSDQVSAKRSLSFPAPEMPSEESPELITSKPQSGEDGLNDEKKEYNVHPESNTSVIHQNPERKSLIFSKNEIEFEKGESIEINLDAHERKSLILSKNETEFEKGESIEINLDTHGQLGSMKTDSRNKIDDEFKYEHEKEIDSTVKEPSGRPGKKNAFSIEPSPDSIAGRLRRRYGTDGNHDETMGVNDDVLNGAGKNVDEGYTVSPKLMKRDASATEHSPDSTAARLKQRRKLGKDHDEMEAPGENGRASDEDAENTSSQKESKANLKHSTSGTNMDCIARRLRPRSKAL